VQRLQVALQREQGFDHSLLEKNGVVEEKKQFLENLKCIICGENSRLEKVQVALKETHFLRYLNQTVDGMNLLLQGLRGLFEQSDLF